MSDPFAITTMSNTIQLDADRRGAASITVFNASGLALRGRAAVQTVPPGQPHAAWATLEGEVERDFAIGATEQVVLRVQVPADAAPGSYLLRLDMTDTRNPDERHSSGPSLTFVVPEPEVKPSRPVWIYIVPIVALLVVIGIILAVVLTRPRTVPDVVNLDRDAAWSAIEAAGFTLAEGAAEFSETVGAGLVARSEPPGGERVKRGSAVTIFLSNGPEPRFVTVPDVVGMAVAEAQDALEAAGLRQRRGASLYSDTVAAGRVAATDPAAGASVEPDTRVTWQESLGLEPTPMPDPPTICSGQTQQGATAWQQYGANGLYVDVDTSACGLTETPLYFTSLGGSSSHWITTGGTSIYNPTPTSLRIYLYNPDPINPDSANGLGWYVNWQAVTADLQADGICFGRTDPTATPWTPYNNDIVTNVPFTGCNFTEPPLVITSIGGVSNQWRTTGPTSLYDVTASGFTVYVNADESDINPDTARQWNWHINWLAVAPDLRLPTLCSGRTPEGVTAWQDYRGSAILVDVDASGCGFTAAPRYFTTLYGRSNHWVTTGGSAIYSASANGFRVYVRRIDADITPVRANDWGWSVVYLALPAE